MFNYYFDHMGTDQNMQFIKDPLFISAYSKSISAIGQDLNIKMRVHQAIWASEQGIKLDGTFIELGTGKGFIFISIMSYLSAKYGNNNLPRVYLFDTFLPSIPNPISGSQNENNMRKKPRKGIAYASSLSDTRQKFIQWPSVKLIEGKLPTSILNYLDEIGEIAFLHVDLNHYLAEVETLAYIWDRMKNGSIIILDDYANKSRETQMHAHNKFFQEKKHSILTTASGQGIVVVNR